MALRRALLAASGTALLAIACGNASGEAQQGAARSPGDNVYRTYCTLCHGNDGALGIGGAKDLAASTLTKDELVSLVANGKGTMMPYKNTLTPQEIEAVAEHVLGLRAR